MAKSSLKTFLKGENPSLGLFLKGAFNGQAMLVQENTDASDYEFKTLDGVTFYIDVLDDGTAITYCPDK